MKIKITLLFTLVLCLFMQVVFAQERTITGKVTSAENNEALPGVGITVNGATIGALTDAEGNFSIEVPEPGSVLLISFLGYLTQEITPGNRNYLEITLQPDVAQLEQVVVTAFGISREKRALGYAAQEVRSDEIASSRQSNLVNALQGKVAGVTISSTGGAPGQGSSILIRGINSIALSRSSEPLFVIDGVLLDNSTFLTGEGAELRGMTNRAADINPDDIESISVLKGGAATALYGLRGSNGVVVITTKSGKAGRLRVNLSSSAGLEEVNKFPEVQKRFSQGTMGVYDPDGFFPSWGPPVEEAKSLDPTHPDELYDNYRRGYEGGMQIRNTLTLSGGTGKSTFSTSLAQLHHEGVLPFTDYDNLSIRANGNLVFSEKFSTGASLNYINSGGDRYNADRFNESLSYWSPRWDVRDYIKEDGTMQTYGNNNPIYGAFTNRFKDNVNRLVGNVSFSYKPMSWMDITYRFGLDTYRDGRTRTAPGPKGVADEIVYEDNDLGFVNEYRLDFRAINSTLILGLNHQLGEDFNGTLRLGGDLYDRKIGRVSTEGSELGVYNWFDLRNAKVVVGDQYNEAYRLMGFFGELTLDYRQFLYLTLTGRNDITSTLVRPNNSFFYPSASLAYVFSDSFEMPDFINYGKLRVSFAGIGKDAPPYATTVGYSRPDDFPVENTIGFSRDGTLGDQGLVPERTETIDVGAEMQLLDNRLGFDITFYRSISTNQIISVPVSHTTGYSDVFVNSGKIRNKGIELILNGSPVRNENFRWDASLNFSANRNKVLSLREGLDEIFISDQFGYVGSAASTKLIAGESIGNIYGSYFKRYYGSDAEDPLRIDKSKPIVIGADGFPVREPVANQKILGNSFPKWIGSLTNRFSYKSFGLSFMLDVRQGVQRFNQFENFIAAFGIGKYTENRDQTIVFDGVLEDGTPNTKAVYLGQGIGPDGEDYEDGYYRRNYRTATENFVQDASWIRLRTLSLSYNLPQKILARSPLSAASLTFTGNNLWLKTDYTTFDPETSSNPSGSNINTFSGFTYPAVRSYLLTLNVSF